MSDFSKAVVYLDYQKSRQATKTEAANSSNRFDKYYSYSKSRDTKKIHYEIILPAFKYDAPLPLVTGVPSTIIFQWNVTFRADFYLGALTNSGMHNGYLCIKWTMNDGTVYRYIIMGEQNGAPPAPNILFENYSNQLIRKNCCFEFWKINPGIPAGYFGFTSDITIQSSVLANPSYPEQLNIPVSQNAAKTATDFALAFPLAVPADNSVMAFLPN